MKKTIKIYFYEFTTLIILMLFVSCNNTEKHHAPVTAEPVAEVVQPLESGKVFDRITHKGSSYSLYIPSTFKEKEKLPVIILIDPHGKGNFPVEKYHSLAEQFGFMLMGSNDSKNGMDFQQCMSIVDDLHNEAFTVLPGNENQITLAGFSGGAKVALYCGNSVSGFNSIVYCGAAFPPASIEVKVPVLAFAGSRDMNYTEVKNFNQSLVKSGMLHSIVEWKGKHEWPDTTAFTHAFYWNIFNSMRNKIIPKNEMTITNFRKILDATIEKEKNLIVKSLFLEEGIEMLNGISSTDNYKKELTALTNSSTYKESKKKQDMTLSYEDDRKKEFASSFETKEISWWMNQIAQLSKDTNNQSDQRILGYISLASWSYSSKSVAANNVTFAQKALQIYKLADPKNSEQPFLEACLYSKNGNQDSAMYFINEAIKLGLDDRNKIETEKDLSELRNRSDFQEMIGKLH